MTHSIPEEITIDADHEGKRLDQFVAAHFAVSRARAQKLIEGATVNGVAAKASHTLKPGDSVALAAVEFSTPSMYDAVDAEKLQAWALPRILFEDEYLMVLVKPRGLAVHPGAGERQATLVDILRHSGRPLSSVGPAERSGIVHRLDKETSGVMMVCKTDEAHWKLAEDFQARRVRKTYPALVSGVPPERGRIEVPIARHHVNRKKMVVSPGGRPSITEYTRIKNWQKYSLLEIDLLTGRTHQIRVHLAYVHYPVVGDEVYGGLRRAIESARTPELRAAIEAMSGQALHATRLQFTHPTSGELLDFTSEMPADMGRIIDRLNEL